MATQLKEVRIHIQFEDYSLNQVGRAYKITPAGMTGLADISAARTKIDATAGFFDAFTFCGIRKIGYGFVYNDDTTENVFEKNASTNVSLNQRFLIPVYVNTTASNRRTINFPGANITVAVQGAGSKRDVLQVGAGGGAALAAWMKTANFAFRDRAGATIDTVGNGLLSSKQSYKNARRSGTA
jgi:hypothetical protein